MAFSTLKTINKFTRVEAIDSEQFVDNQSIAKLLELDIKIRSSISFCAPQKQTDYQISVFDRLSAKLSTSSLATLYRSFGISTTGAFLLRPGDTRLPNPEIFTSALYREDTHRRSEFFSYQVLHVEPVDSTVTRCYFTCLHGDGEIWIGRFTFPFGQRNPSVRALNLLGGYTRAQWDAYIHDFAEINTRSGKDLLREAFTRIDTTYDHRSLVGIETLTNEDDKEILCATWTFVHDGASAITFKYACNLDIQSTQGTAKSRYRILSLLREFRPLDHKLIGIYTESTFDLSAYTDSAPSNVEELQGKYGDKIIGNGESSSCHLIGYDHRMALFTRRHGDCRSAYLYCLYNVANVSVFYHMFCNRPSGILPYLADSWNVGYHDSNDSILHNFFKTFNPNDPFDVPNSVAARNRILVSDHPTRHLSKYKSGALKTYNSVYTIASSLCEKWLSDNDTRVLSDEPSIWFETQYALDPSDRVDSSS
jgi:hypothetical protein